MTESEHESSKSEDNSCLNFEEASSNPVLSRLAVGEEAEGIKSFDTSAAGDASFSKAGKRFSLDLLQG